MMKEVNTRTIMIDLENYRIRYHISVEELAERAGIDMDTFNAYKDGQAEITMTHYIAMCKVLGIDPAMPFYGLTIKPEDPFSSITEPSKNGEPARLYFECAMCAPAADLSFECRKDEKPMKIDKDVCGKCPSFQSRYIQYPISISRVDLPDIDVNQPLRKQGTLVSIRPCGDEYENKTFLGIYLGELPWLMSANYHTDDKSLHVHSLPNPAIYVFELRKIIYGCESWWHAIENASDLSEITDADIENTWYVKLLKELSNKGESKDA